MQLLGTEKKTNHATSWDKKKSLNLSVPKKSRNLSGQKIMQPIGTTKNHATSWGKNVLKIQILVTIKLQEIGTGHLGLVHLMNGSVFRAATGFARVC